MIYDIDDPNRKPYYFRVFDATGKYWSFCTRIDTETGEITRYQTDDQNKMLWTENRDGALTETIFAPAPLRIEPLSEIL